MANELRLRRGTAADHAVFTGADSELTFDTTNLTLRVHDGATVGGFQMARADLTNVDDNALTLAILDSGIVSNAAFIEGTQDIVGTMFTNNTASISTTYDDNTGKILVNANPFNITLTGKVNGSALITDLSNTNITTTIGSPIIISTETTGNYVRTITGLNGITVSGSGVHDADVSLSIDGSNPALVSAIQTVVGGMVSGNNETGITVTYDSLNGKLDFSTNAVGANSVTLGTDTAGNYVATAVGTNGITVTGSGTETAAITIEPDFNNSTFITGINGIVGDMVTNTTQINMSVTYNSTTQKLEFVANPFGGNYVDQITGAGAVTATPTVNGTTYSYTLGLNYFDTTFISTVQLYANQAVPVEVHAFRRGQPAASEVVHTHIFLNYTAMAANATGSRAGAAVAATAQTDFDVQKNGVSIGTMSFAAAATLATFNTNATTFNAGDVISIVAPASPDATLSDIVIGLYGLRP